MTGVSERCDASRHLYMTITTPTLTFLAISLFANPHRLPRHHRQSITHIKNPQVFQCAEKESVILLFSGDACECGIYLSSLPLSFCVFPSTRPLMLQIHAPSPPSLDSSSKTPSDELLPHAHTTTAAAAAACLSALGVSHAREKKKKIWNQERCRTTKTDG
ncbi:hypothetical protein IWX90DRAFT_421845 [Phyllosticta citrichinensis]|uniref:Uncharacterized protein n=1 Tax=Phyllosticta citrichinensis TaxID=1130410 RepID=A0ABR1Y764_9PEZI